MSLCVFKSVQQTWLHLTISSNYDKQNFDINSFLSVVSSFKYIHQSYMKIWDILWCSYQVLVPFILASLHSCNIFQKVVAKVIRVVTQNELFIIMVIVRVTCHPSSLKPEPHFFFDPCCSWLLSARLSYRLKAYQRGRMNQWTPMRGCYFL